MPISRRTLQWLSVLLPFCLPAVFAAESYEAISQPSADLSLSFVRGGLVAEVKVVEGANAGKGDTLVRLDDSVDRIRLQQAELEAQDTAKVEAAEAETAQKKADAEKIRWAHEKGAATDWEMEHARLDAVVAAVQLRLARSEQRLAGLRAQEMAAEIAQMQLTAPVEGVIEEVRVEQGEGVQALEPAVRLVRTDPLWVDVPVPLAVAAGVVAGQQVVVLFPGAVELPGAVLHKAGVAEAASETVRVRVAVSNPAGRPAGERVRVAFPATSPATKNEDTPRAGH